MIQSRNETLRNGNVTGNVTDVLVVGAGVFGLWAARRAIRAGKRVTVVEKRQVGAGASGGIFGALMPHMPDRWSALKQLQFEGLASLEAAIGELEADTGLDCGFRRCGRLMPIRAESSLAQIEARVAGSAQRWGGRFRMERLDPAAIGAFPAGWIDPAHAPCGLQWDDFSARIDPRAYLVALAAFVRDRGELREGVEIARLEPDAGRAVLADGSVIAAGEIVVANGWEAYPLLQPFLRPANEGQPIGRGVKGQGVMMAFDHDDSLPIVAGDGVYVVPHAGNRVAIGATTDDDWQAGDTPSPEAFDPGETEFLERAQMLVPVLREADITERWAGVRPRNMLEKGSTVPFLGPVPGHDNLFALIGGFKIGFGLAHLDPGDINVS